MISPSIRIEWKDNKSVLYCNFLFLIYRIILSDYTNTLYQLKFLFLIIYTQQCWDTQLGFSRLPYGKNHTIPHLSQITFVQNLTFSMLDTDILYSLSYCYKWLSSLFYLWDAHLEENQLVFVFLRITTTQDRSMKNIFYKRQIPLVFKLFT